jgi:aryl-alcohol dehydrogenase-like predicted oxidoreductase
MLLHALLPAPKQAAAQPFFASGGRTLGQAALKFVLASPEVASTLPNIYGKEQIEEFAATSETPDLTSEELSRVAELYENDFGLEK